MKKLLLLVLLCFSALRALAAAPSLQYVYFVTTGSYTSASAACQAYMSTAQGQIGGSTITSVSVDEVNRFCRYKDGTGNGIMSVPYTRDQRLACGDGGPPDTSKPLAQQCPDPCNEGEDMPTDVSGPGGSFSSIGGNVRGSTYCGGNCVVSGTNQGSTCVTIGEATSCTTFFTGAKKTGGGCSSNVNAGSNPAPVCGPGMTMGQVNGRDTCLKSGDTGSQNKTPTKTTQSTSSPPTTTTTTNPDGSTTTKTTETTITIGPGGTQTKTTETSTTTNPDGLQTKDVKTTTTGSDDPFGEKEKERDDLCKLHPELNICRNSTVSGDCESVVCTGDAITCAIAKSTAIANCKLKKAEDDIKALAGYSLGNSVLNGVDPLGPALPKKENADRINVQNLDQSGWLGGGACFSDKTIVVQGHSVVIPFSSACQYLIVFRYVIMIIALLVSFRVLSGSILRE